MPVGNFHRSVLYCTVEPPIKDPLNKGHYVKPLNKGSIFGPKIFNSSMNYSKYNLLIKDNLSIKDKCLDFVLVPKSPLLRGSTVYYICHSLLLQCGLFNFDQAVRPLQLELHIDGFPNKDYHLRMTSMNKPVYRAIKTHSPDKPVIVFVSSPSQTRLTAFDFVAFLATEDNPKQWLHMSDKEVNV